jgi:hypothetical protein
MKASSPKSVRCAIYTRVSTEQGLDQDFNSLDAQCEASSALGVAGRGATFHHSRGAQVVDRKPKYPCLKRM